MGMLLYLFCAVVVLWLVVHLLALPFKLVWNGIIGALMLWLFNLVGSLFHLSVHITIFKALVAGFFGIPGAVVVILWELFAK
ncbi:MAG: pro-sigmaK processing inhibitor BofA family protein [Succiniclasticum sp.]|nr:pro-sigmaK processing inhibitor BofA family protein [Succiniclasticum sp.]